ncbi:MAG: hypothetical protein ACPGNP_02080 [Acidimicrobiales bacterium]
MAVAVPVPEAEGESVPETETFALALGVVILAGIVVAGIVVVAVFVLLDAIGLTLIGSVVVGGIRFRLTVTDALVGSVLVGSVGGGVLSVFGRLDLDGYVDDIVLRRLRALGVGLVRIRVLGGVGLRCCVVGFARRRLGDHGALVGDRLVVSEVGGGGAGAGGVARIGVGSRCVVEDSSAIDGVAVFATGVVDYRCGRFLCRR